MRIFFSRSFRRCAGNYPRRGFSSLLSRFYSSVEADAGGGGFKIFDRDLKRKQRDRAAWLARPKDVLVDTVATNILDRLQDCKKTFPTALCMGGSFHAVRRLMRGHEHGGIEKLIMMDMSEDMIRLCKKHEQDDQIEMVYVVGDEENLPMEECSLDLVISCLGLHWTNDLPGAMIQCRLALKPDGLFLAAILGGETLKELRIACTVAQMEREGGISPRMSPLAQVRDAGNLLTRAGFTLPGVDVDEYVVRYGSALELIEHLRAMGETNALLQRHAVLKRETALATAAIYESMFAAEDGTIPATFQVIYMTGWKEHPSQQKAKKRGSATISFTQSAISCINPPTTSYRWCVSRLGFPSPPFLPRQLCPPRNMSLGDAQIGRLFKIRRTALQMLRDRGYAVEDAELEMTRTDFVQKFGVNMRRRDLTILTEKESDPSDRIYVFFQEGEKSGVPEIRNYINRMKTEGVRSSILVIEKSLTPAAKAGLNEMNASFNMQVFEEAELLVNITEHALVPEHRVLNQEEKKALLAKYGIKEAQLPRILFSDPVARYYGMKRGQVVKITRFSETAKTYETYRFCV
ncbi:hypothetical protein MLD38_015167 [Melastoma candidum]|uniref:Uncharacterized protein n=1 Tax=Melastoma candidum TaxID=119954 RepID=A0ACB9RF39_9MYRT|nr:hypothetical protein MLD38_015167 [Melastoma candidum]